MPLDPSRTLRELAELRDLTGDEAGAQRLCWTPGWRRAREWMATKLAELPVAVSTDEAGNRWATLPGGSPALILGSHIDSVPDGGWLDGSLGLLAGLEVLRAFAEAGEPPVEIRLVDWADEEGARFGCSLFGSSAASGRLDVETAGRLHDREGRSLRDVLREHGVELAAAHECRARLAGAGAYLELHIEQGPILEQLGLPLGVVTGTFAAERHGVRFAGQSAHAGSTPMHQRRDAAAGAARLTLAVREEAARSGGVGTVGRITTHPGIPNVIAGRAEMTIDLRHPERAVLEAMSESLAAATRRIAREEGLESEQERMWHTEAIAFSEDLVELAAAAVTEVAGASHRMASGPLHDAAEMAASGIPAVMLFAQSLGGLSHTVEEDTRPEDIELAVVALHRLAMATADRLASEIAD